jgi:hypothetical protein
MPIELNQHDHHHLAFRSPNVAVLGSYPVLFFARSCDQLVVSIKCVSLCKGLQKKGEGRCHL